MARAHVGAGVAVASQAQERKILIFEQKARVKEGLERTCQR
jgi:hypothetical protein